MTTTANFSVAKQGERAIVMQRVFDAPREMVFDAFSKPELLRRWFGPRGWSLVECEVDLRVGGGFRFVIEGPGGRRMRMRGEYRELRRPERSVHLEWLDDFPSSNEVTAEMTEEDGKTTLHVTIMAESQFIRDQILASGMERGVAESYDKLAEMLAPGQV